MGADLCITWLLWDKNRRLDFKAGHDYIDTLETNESGQLVDENGGEWDRETIHEKLKNIENASNNEYREGSVIEILHLYMLVTGGMSWGDSPSELYNDINDLSSLDFGILTRVGFDLPEDTLNYKELVKKIIGVEQIRPLLLGLDENLDKLLEREGRLQQET